MKRIVFVFLGYIFYSLNSFAVCTSPSGGAGVLKYNSGTMQFCDGSSWINACASGGCSAGAACTTAGQMQYFAGANMMRWCNGSNWYDAGSTTGAACTKAGIMDYDTGGSVMRFCNWVKLHNNRQWC